jgi:hypothetical protein
MADKLLIQVPSSEKDLLKVCQENFRKLQNLSGKVYKVEGDTYSESRDPGKVKATSADTTSDYLDGKLIEGNDIDLVETTSSAGVKTLVANLNVYSGNSAPSAPTDNMLWYDEDEPEPEYLDIGDNAAGTDFAIRFLGENNDGIYRWMEDEDYLKAQDGILMDSAEEIFFRDTAISIKSANDGHLDLTADTSIDLNGALTHSISVQTTTYSVAATDYVIVCNSATGFTVTLPTAAATGRILIVKNINTGNITISKSGDTIDGAASQVLSQWDAITLCDYAANAWIII